MVPFPKSRQAITAPLAKLQVSALNRPPLGRQRQPMQCNPFSGAALATLNQSWGRIQEIKDSTAAY